MCQAKIFLIDNFAIFKMNRVVLCEITIVINLDFIRLFIIIDLVIIILYIMNLLLVNQISFFQILYLGFQKFQYDDKFQIQVLLDYHFYI